MIQIEDPLIDGDRIRNGVKAGVIVRTRIDVNTVEARTRELGKAVAVAPSDARPGSTDYYPRAPDPHGWKFTVTLPRGALHFVRIAYACSVVP